MDIKKIKSTIKIINNNKKKLYNIQEIHIDI